MSRKRRKRGITKRQAMRRRRITKLVLFGLVVFSLYSIVYKTKIFNIKKINVTGNKKITSEEIIKKSTFKEGFKIFNFEKKSGIENIEKLPYIKSADIKRKLPNIVNITVSERTPIVMASYIDKLMLLDKEGYVLEFRNREEEFDFPDISGVEINNIKEGQKLFQGKNAKDQVQFIEIASKNNTLNKMRYINFSNMNDIVIELKTGEKVYLGNLNDMEEKLLMLNETLANLEERDLKALKIELRDSSKAVVSTGEEITEELEKEELENDEEDGQEENEDNE